MYQNIAIDCNNLYWRTVASCIKETISVDKDVLIYSEVIKSFIDRVNYLKKKYCYSKGKVYLIWDNPLSKINIRKIIDESYKNERADKNLPVAFYDTIKVLQQVLLNYDDNFVMLKMDYTEADDLVLPLIQHLEKKEESLLLISADLDWARGIR